MELITHKLVIIDDNSRTIQRQSVATSVLKKIGGNWKIIQNHGSSRSIKKN